MRIAPSGGFLLGVLLAVVLATTVLTAMNTLAHSSMWSGIDITTALVGILAAWAIFTHKREYAHGGLSYLPVHISGFAFGLMILFAAHAVLGLVAIAAHGKSPIVHLLRMATAGISAATVLFLIFMERKTIMSEIE